MSINNGDNKDDIEECDNPWYINFNGFDEIYSDLFADDEEDEDDDWSLVDELKKCYENLDKESNHEYCKCKKPELVKSYVLGESFNYCRGCKKEKK